MVEIQTSMGPLTVEKAELTDIDRVLDILTGAIEWLTARRFNQWAPGHFTREGSAAAIERGEVYLGKIGGYTVGTLRLQWADERTWGVMPDNAGYVRLLAVDRNYAGHQIGKAMLLWAEGQVAMSGRKYLRLSCFASNYPLRDYYLRAGFTLVNEINQGEWDAALFEREVEQIPLELHPAAEDDCPPPCFAGSSQNGRITTEKSLFRVLPFRPLLIVTCERSEQGGGQIEVAKRCASTSCNHRNTERYFMST